MKKIFTTVAALGLAAVINTSHTTEAKADGGVIIGVGAYLLVDALVGRHCHRDEWPFNLVRKVGDELHGRPGCHRGYRNRHHRHNRHW
jgi:hypothetical protein